MTGLLALLVAFNLYAAKKAKNAGSMDEQTRELHVLDRLTFGQRPGDISKKTHQTIEERIVTPQATAQFEDPGRAPNVNVIAGLLLGSPEFQRK